MTALFKELPTVNKREANNPVMPFAPMYIKITSPLEILFPDTPPDLPFSATPKPVK
jgi:hypothetical protein